MGGVGDYIDIKPLDQLRKPVGQGFGAQAAPVVGASDDYFGNAAGQGIFGNMNGRVAAVHGGYPGAQLFCQLYIVSEPFLVFLTFRDGT